MVVSIGKGVVTPEEASMPDGVVTVELTGSLTAFTVPMVAPDVNSNHLALRLVRVLDAVVTVAKPVVGVAAVTGCAYPGDCSSVSKI